MHGVRLTPLRMATLAREISAKVTGRDSSTLSRSDLVFLKLGDGSWVFDDLSSSETTPENGLGVVIGYLYPAAARALIAARLVDDLANLPEDAQDEAMARGTDVLYCKLQEPDADVLCAARQNKMQEVTNLNVWMKDGR